jgi:hypothetical protein
MGYYTSCKYALQIMSILSRVIELKQRSLELKSDNVLSEGEICVSVAVVNQF